MNKPYTPTKKAQAASYVYLGRPADAEQEKRRRARQLQACHIRAKEFGAEVVAEYIDRDDGRAMLRRRRGVLLRRLRRPGDLDFVVVTKRSLLATTPTEQARIARLVKDRGAWLLVASPGPAERALERFAREAMAIAERSLLAKGWRPPVGWKGGGQRAGHASH